MVTLLWKRRLTVVWTSLRSIAGFQVLMSQARLCFVVIAREGMRLPVWLMPDHGMPFSIPRAMCHGRRWP